MKYCHVIPAIIFTIVLIFLTSLPVFALGHTVANDSDGSLCPPENHLVYYSGWYYAFYDHYWKSSSDGQTWGNASDLNTDSYLNWSGLDCASWGNEVAVAAPAVIGGNYYPGFRLGYLDLGNITWAADWQAAGSYVGGSCGDVAGGFGVAIDGTGHYWVGYTDYAMYVCNMTYLIIRGSSSTDGTWTEDLSKESIVARWGGWTNPGSVKPVGLTSTCDVFYTAGGHYLYMRQWNTDANVWGNEFRTVAGCVSIGGTVGYGAFSVARAPDDTVSYAYEVNPGGNIDYGYFYAVGDRRSSETVIATAASAPPALGIGELSDDVFVWWASGATLYVNEQFGYSGNWTGIQALGNESLGFGSDLSSVFSSDDISIGVMYHTGTTAIQYYKFYGNESAPVVTTFTGPPTSWTWDGHEWSSTALLRAHLDYDGSAGCEYRFGYRLTGSGTWIYSPWYDDIRSPAEFDVSLYGLTPDTSYEMFGQAANNLLTGNGSVVTFTSAGISSMPGTTPTPGGGPTNTPTNITIPGFPTFHLSVAVKIFLALLVTILSMALLGYLLRTVPMVALVCALAVGLMWIIAFAAWGWLPGWIILAIVIILGMLILLVVLSKR